MRKKINQRINSDLSFIIICIMFICFTQALLEIDKLLAKLDRDETKSIKTITCTSDEKKSPLKDDKPITYRDSLTDVLDKLLEDMEHMDDDF